MLSIATYFTFAVRLEPLDLQSLPCHQRASAVAVTRLTGTKAFSRLDSLARRHLMTCIVRSEMAGLSCISRFRYPKVSRSHIMQAASLVLDIKDSHSSYYHFIRPFFEIQHCLYSHLEQPLMRQIFQYSSRTRSRFLIVCVESQPSGAYSLPSSPVPLLHRLLLGIIIFRLRCWMVIWLISCVRGQHPHFELRAPVCGEPCEFGSRHQRVLRFVFSTGGTFVTGRPISSLYCETRR